MGFSRKYFESRAELDRAFKRNTKYNAEIIDISYRIRTEPITSNCAKNDFFFRDLSKDEILLLFYSALENKSFFEVAEDNLKSYILDSMFKTFYVDLLDSCSDEELDKLAQAYLKAIFHHTPSCLHMAMLLSVKGKLDLPTQMKDSNLIPYLDLSYMQKRLRKRMAPSQYEFVYS